MLISDLALLETFKVHVERYAKDQALFFRDYAAAHVIAGARLHQSQDVEGTGCVILT